MIVNPVRYGSAGAKKTRPVTVYYAQYNATVVRLYYSQNGEYKSTFPNSGTTSITVDADEESVMVARYITTYEGVTVKETLGSNYSVLFVQKA